jgi:hypothetical protein
MNENHGDFQAAESICGPQGVSSRVATTSSQSLVSRAAGVGLFHYGQSGLSHRVLGPGQSCGQVDPDAPRRSSAAVLTPRALIGRRGRYRPHPGELLTGPHGCYHVR